MSATEPNRPRLRLVQVVVTPTFVVEDEDGTLEPFQPEHEGKPIDLQMLVSPKAWPTYATEKWPEAVAQIEAQFLTKANGD